MNFFRFLLIFIISFSFMIKSTFGNEKIVFIDINYIINNSEAGKTILDNLTKTHEKNKKELELKKKDLQNKEKEIKKTSNVISKEDLNKKIELFKIEVKDFNQLQNKMDKDFAYMKNTQMKNLMKKINPLIEKYMTENSIDLILKKDDIFIAKESINISESILKLINENIK